MMHVITGGSASGKSAYAERMASGMYGEEKKSLYYIATMHPFGEEGRKRIEKHRAMRSGKGFRTVECFQDLDQLFLPGAEGRTVILLECMSNLLANEQFSVGGTDTEILARIQKGIRHLLKISDELVVVTNEVFSDGEAYDPDTMRYLHLLGKVNQMLSEAADFVTEVVYGIPIPIKGENRVLSSD